MSEMVEIAKLIRKLEEGKRITDRVKLIHDAWMDNVLDSREGMELTELYCITEAEESLGESTLSEAEKCLGDYTVSEVMEICKGREECKGCPFKSVNVATCCMLCSCPDMWNLEKKR